MKKAATTFSVLIFCTTLTALAAPEGTSEHRGQTGLALAGSSETPGFSLAGSGDPFVSIGTVNLDRQDLGELATAEIGPEVASPGFKRDPSAPLVSVSVFLGRGNGDIFSTLHEEYVWKMKFKSMTLGVGIYRDIRISKGIRLQPYMGVIRASATLRPSDFYGNHESFEYRLTVFCIGIPLVCGFN
jgi:hypothetical protein